MKKRIIILGLVLSFLPISLFAQLLSTQGTDFIFSYSSISTGSPFSQIKVAADSLPTFVTIKYNGLTGAAQTQTFTVPAGEVYTYQFSPAQRTAMIANATPSRQTVEVHTDHSVSVYIINSTSNTGDATCVLPVPSLEKEYRMMTRIPSTGNRPAGYIVAAIENGTVVQRNGIPTVTLNAGEAVLYDFPSTSDATGTLVSANNPIALFSYCEQMQHTGGSTGMLFEQLMPVKKWGIRFLVPTTLAGVDYIRVLAHYNNTVITRWLGAIPTIYNLNAGQYMDMTTSDATNGCWIESNYPVMVGSYVNGSFPALSQIPACMQAIASIGVAAFTGLSNLPTHEIIVLAPTSSRNLTRVKIGSAAPAALTGGSWIDGAGPNSFSYYKMPVASGNVNSTHVFSNPEGGVIVWVYGYGSNSSYYYMGGAAAKNYEDEFFVDNVSNTELEGTIECHGDTMKIWASITRPLYPVSGNITWFYDGTEVLTARDSLIWYLPSPSEGSHSIMMRLLDVIGDTIEYTTHFIQRCLYAEPDWATTANCVQTIVDVLDNDVLKLCSRTTVSVAVTTPPLHGTAVFNINKNIVYTPDTNFTGRDSLAYTLTCDTVTSTAKLYIAVSGCPENIMESQCFGKPQMTTFGIKELSRSATEVSAVTTPLAGDIDGDGEIEIVALNHTGATNASASDAIHIYGFEKITNTLYLKYAIPLSVNNDFYTGLPLAIAKVDNHPYASVFYASPGNMTLYKYDFDGTVWAQSWSRVYSVNAAYSLVSPVVADIMGDGRTQVVILNKVIDTRTGVIIAEGAGMLPASGRSAYSFGCFGHLNQWGAQYESTPVVIDIDGDGIQEVIGGDCVYGIHLVDFENLDAENTFQLKQRASIAGHPEVGDGGTAIADIDHCGQLEVIVAGPVSNNYASANGMLYVYNPRTGKILHSNTIADIPRQANANGPSRPCIGDMDDYQYPEIAVTGSQTLRGYRYESGQLNQIWQLPTTDISGATTLSLFNFAHDGKNRLIYRDQNQLRILDASVSPPVTSAFLNTVESPTINELPIIVDINSDGAAEIIVTANDKASSPDNYKGEVRVYASDRQPWAPARKVWNQAAYYSLNVNDDLSIPAIQMSPATVFPGIDGILGTPNDVRPYNGFLMQQTTLDMLGVPIFLLPNPLMEPLPVLAIAGDSAIITGSVTNTGSAALVPPVYITFYKNDTITGNIIQLDSIPMAIMPDSTVYFSFTIHDICSLIPVESIWISINDKNNEYPYQKQCAPARYEFERRINNDLPTISSPYGLCFTDHILTLADIEIQDEYLRWYETETGTDTVALTTPVVNGASYWVSKLMYACESDRVNVELQSATDAPTSPLGAQSFCGSPTIDSLITRLSGADIKIYASATATLPILGSMLLENGTTYYASQTINDCESFIRLAVTVTLQIAPTITHSTGTQNPTICHYSAITDIEFTLGGSATGATISWSPSAPTGISFDGTTATISGTPTGYGTFNYTINTTGQTAPCTAATIGGTIIVEACACANPPILTLAQTSAFVCGLDAITIERNSFDGGATQIVSITKSANASGMLSYSSLSTSPFDITYEPDATDIGKTIKIGVTTNSLLPLPCEPATDTITIHVYDLAHISITPPVTTTLSLTEQLINLATTGSAGDYVWTYFDRKEGVYKTVGTTNGLAVDSGGRYIVTVTDANGCIAKDSIDIKVTLFGTVFPFVHWNNSIDNEFSVTVSLKSVPENQGGLSATLNALMAEMPLTSTVTEYHDVSIFIERSPLAPGVIGSILNPGEEIDWDDFRLETRTNLVRNLEPDEEPDTYQGITSGYYELAGEVGDYILEIKRTGYVVRWAPITITPTGVQYLGHREIIAGDIDQNRIITQEDADEMETKMGGYFGDDGLYDPKYDLNSDGKIDQLDYDIIVKFLNFQLTNYKETRLWLEILGF
jgi:hypothetical protein